MDIGDLPVILRALKVVKTRSVPKLQDIVSAVTKVSGETCVQIIVQSIVPGVSVTKAMVNVHRDAHQEGMEMFVIEPVVLDVQGVHVNNTAESVRVKIAGQGIVVTDVKIHIMVPIVPKDAVKIASTISVTISLDTVQMNARLDSTGTCVTVAALHARQHVTEVQGFA